MVTLAATVLPAPITVATNTHTELVPPVTAIKWSTDHSAYHTDYSDPYNTRNVYLIYIKGAYPDTVWRKHTTDTASVSVSSYIRAPDHEPTTQVTLESITYGSSYPG